MKKFFTLTLLTFLSLSIGLSQPDFTFTDTDGNSHTLSEALANGKVILLDFYFVDCPPCNTWGPEIEQIAADFEGTTLEVWALSDRDNDAKILGSIFAPEHSNHFTTGTAGGGPDVINTWASEYNFIGFPTYTLIFPDGSVMWDIWPLTPGVSEIRDHLTEENGVVPLTSSVKDIEGLLNSKIYPNPASEMTTMEFDLESAMDIRVDVTNVLGQVVLSIPSQNYTAGTNNISLDVKEFNTGLYMIRMQSKEGTRTFELIVE